MFKRVCMVFLCVLLCLGICACGKSEEVKQTEAAIAGIGVVTLESEDLIVAAEELYNNLPEEEKEDVENYALLTEARATYDTLLIERVETLIGEIGTVTLNSGDKIDAARAAYDAMGIGLQASVGNYDVLTEAEETYEMLVLVEANTVKNFRSISAEGANLFDMSANGWYSDSDASAMLFLVFEMQGMSDKTIDIEKTKISQQYVAIFSEDGRVDVIAPYGDDQVIWIQYWPNKGTAQFGTVKTDLDIEEYLELMVNAGRIDSYKAIPLANISKMLNLLS